MPWSVPVSNDTPAYVLDSFAVLAYLAREGGALEVQGVLQRAEQGLATASMSLINLGEVVYIVERRQGLNAAQQVIAALESLPIRFLPGSRERVLAAAHLKATYPIAYGDAFAIAAAQEFGAIIVTGDPDFAAVEDVVPIQWLPRPQRS